jgi:hypothetical protein
LGSESDTCVGSRVRLVGVSISFEKNFYRSHSLPPLWFVVLVLQSTAGWWLISQANRVLELQTRIWLGSSAGREMTKRDPPVGDSERGRLSWAGVGTNWRLSCAGLPRPCRPLYRAGPHAGTTGRCGGTSTTRLSNWARHGHDGRAFSCRA